MAATSTHITELRKTIGEKCDGATSIPGWSSLGWNSVPASSNPIFVPEKLRVGTFAGRPAYAYYALSSNNQARVLCIFRDRDGDLPSEISNALFGNIDFDEPFKSIEASHLNTTERRGILRTVLRACFILRGHPSNHTGEMSMSFKEYFRRGLAIIMKAQGTATPAIPSNEFSPSKHHEKHHESASTAQNSTNGKADTVHVLRQRTASITNSSGATLNHTPTQQPLNDPAGSKSSLITALPNPLPVKMSAPASSESSQAEEDNQLPSDTDDVPKRGCNSAERRLANQMVTPTKRPMGMFDPSNSPTPSPTRTRTRRPAPSRTTPRTTALARNSTSNAATPKKRTYGMFDEGSREDSGSPRSARKLNNTAEHSSPDNATKGSPPSVVIPPKRHKIRLHERIDDSDEDVYNADTAPSGGKQRASLQNAPKLIGDIVALANQEYHMKIGEIFDDSREGNGSNGITAADDGHKTSSSLTVDLHVEPESDHETLFVGSRSVEQAEQEIPEPGTEIEFDLYEGIPLERKRIVREYLRLEAEIKNAQALTTSHQKQLNTFEEEREATATQINNLADSLQKERSVINVSIDREIRALEEKRKAQLKASGVNAEEKKKTLLGKVHDCEVKKAAERSKMDEVQKSTEHAMNMREKMERAGSGFTLGTDVGVVRTRMAQNHR